MAFTSGELRDFVDAVRGSETSTECVVTGTVSRVDADGTAWVQIGQNAEPTPCARDMACHAGDEVTVRIADHKATVTGNASAPATDDKKANVAYNYAGQANETATIADEKAVSAMRAAKTAEEYATDAQESAGIARTSATAASTYATTALAGLGSVQNVADTLMWITQHGQMVLTADTEPDPTKLYFVVDPNGQYTVGGTHYSTVTEVDPDHMGDYYEMSMRESVQNYLLTHLAVTDDGLHVFGDNSRIIVGTNDSFHVVIDATDASGEIAFCQGMTEDEHGNPVHNRVAWITNNELHIPRAIITEGVQVGRYRWVELTNGNFALKYVE
jgi:hypothetical protein